MVGVLVQSVARQLSLPAIVLLLVAGVGMGPSAAGLVEPRSLGGALFAIVDLGVAIILFEGGLNREMSRLRRQEAPIRRLITLGVVVTLVGGTLAVRWLLGWSWSLSVLFGSLVVVTGPTVVMPLLRDIRLRPRIKTILEAEAVLIDPIGAVLSVLVLEVVLAPQAETLALGLRNIGMSLGFGVLSGVLAGLTLGGLLSTRLIVPKGYENIVALAGTILVFHGSDYLVPHSGIVAVTVAGIVVGNLGVRVGRDLREFKDQLTILLVGLLFVLLAADVDTASVTRLGWGGALVVAALVLVVRPAGAWLSTRGSGLKTRERLFIAWIAPRGIVAAAIASLTAAAMEEQQMPGGAELRALVFLTIAGTVFLAGLSARPLGTLLGARLPARDRVALLGVNGLSLALAREISSDGTIVVFLDTDPQSCQLAEQAGFNVVLGDALEERTLARAQFDLVGTAVGMTFNDHLNAVFVGHASEFFNVPKGYAAVERIDGGEPPPLLKRYGGDVLFDGAHELERWDVRARHGGMTVESFVFEGTPDNDSAAARPSIARETHIMLAVTRGRRTTPMHLGFKPRRGDLAAVAVHPPDAEAARKTLATAGWLPAAGRTPSSVPEATTEAHDAPAGVKS